MLRVCVDMFFQTANHTVITRLLSQVVGMLPNCTPYLVAMSFLTQQVSETDRDLYLHPVLPTSAKPGQGEY